MELEYLKKMDNAKVVKHQLHDFKLNHVRRLQEDMLEGELIKRSVLEELEKERQKERNRLEKLKDL